jgi:hypothetical protein
MAAIKTKETENKTKAVRLALVAMLLVLAVFFCAKIVIAPPGPHNVEGRVLNNASGSGAQNGLEVWINNTATGEITIVFTDAPPVPELLGLYSATINGSDNEPITVRSWNATHYGENSSLLAPTTTNVNVVLNTSRPSETNLTILVPSNNSARNTSSAFNLTANISVFGGSGIDCNATIHFSNANANITADQSYTKNFGNINSGSFVVTSWNITGYAEGFVNVTVYSQCASDGINLYQANLRKIWLYVNDTSRPLVNLVSPLNSSWTKLNFTLNYNVSEFTGLKNCTLFIDGRLNQTSPDVEPFVTNNFTLNNTQDGNHSWMVSCHDNSSSFNEGNSTAWNFTSDSLAPAVTLLFPLNNSEILAYRNLFAYNVTDSFNATNCSLILNGEIAATNSSILLNASNNFTYSLTGKDYNWSVNCSDGPNNIGSSGYFRLITPDFFINATFISASSYSFVEQQLVEINATVFNIGTLNSTRNISVIFYENFFTRPLVMANYSVNITSGSNITLSSNYSTAIGTNRIDIIVDDDHYSNGTSIESNEENNNASLSIFVSSYQAYYGRIKSDIVLDTMGNNTVFGWFNLSSFNGVLFAADSDSSLGFNSMIALGRNLSGNITMNDFEEADLRLNLTNYTDSLNRSYTYDGNVVSSSNFTIFLSPILNVPIINTTNTSSFVTGILWDSSDENQGQYNGTQDIAFITKVSKDSLGYYGTYDYEIKIPANLRRYVNPNVDNTITFYREIT